MKKVKILICLIIILLTMLLVTSHVFAATCGDVNDDGNIDIRDALLIAKSYTGNGTVPLTTGDVNDDNNVNVIDSLLISQFYVGNISELPGKCGNSVVEPTTPVTTTEPQSNEEKIDDWEYSNTNSPDATSAIGGIIYSAPVATAAPSSSLGLSVGGAKDINNFRENIENNYFPQYSSLTYEGLFYDYYFDTGEQEETEKLFSPSYSFAVSSDPISNQDECYLSVGLKSGLKEEDFKRRNLNLTIVLDISGSMSSSFDEYYYDEETGEEITKNKLDVACESIVSLLEHLNNDDRFGMVLFDGYGYIGKPMSLVGKTDMEAIKKHILDLTPRGSTNFEAGYKLGTQLFNDIPDLETEEYENRIIFLTDAMPNVGELNEESLLGMTEKNAENKIYSTFIGIGVDFNTDLIEYITKTKGANYYSVHSSEEFKTRMDDEFEYMVTPLVFDLQLNFESSGYEIEKVYGSPEADEATGEIMKVNTLFPSKSSDEGVKGGIILLKLKKISDDTNLTLSTSYEDRNGIVDSDTVSIILENKEANVYPNTGIRKGILLTRYINVLKNWLVNEAEMDSEDLDDIIPIINSNTGIFLADEDECIQILSKWEQKSKPLKVSQEYKELFLNFIPYFEGEMNAIGDNTLTQEIEILKKLSTYEENNL